jgi:nucleoside-diphosphate-sugar epimerase
MPTALVTGAAGFLGRALVRELLGRGYAVRALVREGTDASGLDPRAERVRGDATRADDLRRAVAGQDVVFHLAGVRRGATRDDFLRVNAEGTRLLLEACAAGGAARSRFVLAGSLAAAGPSRYGRREEEPFQPAEWYGESKAEAERLTLAWRDRLPVTVARPPRIMGPGDRENLLFFRIAAAGVVLRILGPERPLSWIDVDDCARGFALLAEHPAAVGEAFFLASPERTSVVALQREVARALGVSAREVPVPPALLSGAGAAADFVGRLTGLKLPVNRKLARQVLAPGWTCRTEKAERLLGFSAPSPLADSLARAVRSYRELGWLRA